MYPDLKIYGVEPAESAILEGGQPGPHKIQGIGTGFVPKVLDTEIFDQAIAVSSEDAMATAREVGRKEGLLVGISSGAAIHAALKVAKELGKGKKVLAIVLDNGERYLSTAYIKWKNNKESGHWQNACFFSPFLKDCGIFRVCFVVD